MPFARKAKDTSLVTRHSSPGILRPLLDTTRGEILDYARGHGLDWIEDESNRDTRLRRNFLRHEILPAIERRFPSYRLTVARAAGHLAEASRVLDEVAAKDGATALKDGTLAVAALRRLPPPRARNLLRYFLAERSVEPPSAARLEEALRQSLSAKQDARMAVDLGDVFLARFGDRLHVVSGGPPPRYAHRWRGETKVVLPEAGGILTFKREKGAGIGLVHLKGRTLTIKPRSGGERLQPDSRRPRRSLKNLLQEARIPPWSRERMPLIFCGSTLVWAANIGVDCSFQAGRGEPGLRPVWSLAGHRG
jgi:tRNA(Ile)-lysidine synthase